MVKTVGVIGGMGPEATVDFLRCVTELTPATCDQDHIPMLVYFNPAVPNRQAAVLSQGQDPGPVLAGMAKLLESAGADFLVMTCNSAHAFASSIEDAVSVPLISIIDVTADACLSRGTIGIMATDGCIASGLYQRALDERALEYILPAEAEQHLLSKAITLIKAGGATEESRAIVRALVESMGIAGADTVVAGCTEIPLALAGSAVPIPVVDSTRELAKATVSNALVAALCRN